MISIVDATIEHARYIGAHLRAGDYCELLVGKPWIHPRIITIESFMISDYCKTVLIDDVPAIIFGVSGSEDKSIGVIWMLSTPQIMRISRRFLKGCKAEVQKMSDEYPYLFNEVYKHNEISINWLKWLGFSMDVTKQNELGFIYFEKGKSCVTQV